MRIGICIKHEQPVVALRNKSRFRLVFQLPAEQLYK